MENSKNDKILVCGGCSFSGDGGINHIDIFIKEFPEDYELLINKDGNLIDDDKYREFIKKHLWSYKLSKLMGYKDCINLSAGGKGLYTTINAIYHYYFNTRNTNIEIFYQLPEPDRLELWVDALKKPLSVISEIEDRSDIKKNFILNFFNSNWNLFTYLNELYKFKLFFSNLGIPVHLIPWNSSFTKTSDSIKQLKECIKYGDGSNHYQSLQTSVDRVDYFDIERITDYLDFIHIDNQFSVTDYLTDVENKPIFIADKYSDISTDKHLCVEGHTMFANKLYDVLNVTT